MIQLELSERTENKMRRVMALNTNVDVFINKVIDYQLNELNIGIRNMTKELSDFEKKYTMRSAEFYEKFDQGLLSDEHDFILWSGVYEMYLRDLAKIEQFK